MRLVTMDGRGHRGERGGICRIGQWAEWERVRDG